jgi:hypothetical protein
LAFVTGGRSAHAPKKLDTGTKIEHKLRAKPRRDRSSEPAAETDEANPFGSRSGSAARPKIGGRHS